MNPILAEIFPYLTKVLVNKKEVLDYKWIVTTIDAYGVLQEDGIYRRAHEDIQKQIGPRTRTSSRLKTTQCRLKSFYFVIKIKRKRSPRALSLQRLSISTHRRQAHL